MIASLSVWHLMLILCSLDLPYNIWLNKLATQKQTSATSTCIKISAAIGLLATLQSFFDYHSIGNTMFSLPTNKSKVPWDPPFFRFP